MAPATTNPLRAARLAKGWTREELAFRAGVSHRTVVRLEQGQEARGEARLSTLKRLATALELDQVELGRELQEAA